MTSSIAQIDLRYHPKRLERISYPVAALADGSPVVLPVQIICGVQPGPRLAVVAGVHGDELEGVRAVQSLGDEISPDEFVGTLILAPVVNVMAFNAIARRSPVDNMDLNRVFPGNANGSVSERLAHHLCRHVLAGCDLVVSLHGWYQQGNLSPWMEFVDAPAPVSQASHDAAQAFGIQDLVGLPMLPGRLISALAALGVPAIEGEVGGQATFAEENWRIYTRGVGNVMAHLGMTHAPALSRLPCEYWALRAVTAPVGGLYERHVVLEERVQKGQQLATIRDLFGQPIAVVEAPCAGKIASVQTVGIALPGAHLFTILESVASRLDTGSRGR